MTNELIQIITNFILITKNQNTFLKNYTLFLIFNIQVEKTFIFMVLGSPISKISYNFVIVSSL